GCFGNGEPFLEVRVPQRHGVLIKTMHDLGERHSELVLAIGKLDAVFDIWHLLTESSETRDAAFCTLHEIGERLAEQVEPRIGEAAQMGGFKRGAGDDTRRSISDIIASPSGRLFSFCRSCDLACALWPSLERPLNPIANRRANQEEPGVSICGAAHPALL